MQTDRRRSSSLHIPWSTREGFTDDVCGLPGLHGGCWRQRQAIGIASSDLAVAEALFKDAILPRDPSLGKASKWLGFLYNINTAQPELELRVVNSPAPPRGSAKGEVWFGFDGSNQSPVALVCRGVSPDGVETAIEGWNVKNQDLSNLKTYFGSAAFHPKILDQDASEGFRHPPQVVRISGLLNSYLDRECDRFRGHRLGREVGISLCHLETRLAQAGLLSKVGLNFTYINPKSLEIEELLSPTSTFDDLAVGFLKRSHGHQPIVRRRDLKSLHASSGDPTVSMPSHQSERQTTFADCFSSWGRQQILPSETSNSFLRFTRQEVQAYLLHWLLLRIFAAESNVEFEHAFRRWQSNIHSLVAKQYFCDLLDTSVTLAPDEILFVRNAGEPSELEPAPLVSNRSRPFREWLETLHISATNRHDLEALAHLFCNEWNAESGPVEGLRFLPMYRATEAMGRTIEWRFVHLRQYNKIEELSCDDLLEHIVATYRHEEGITETQDDVSRRQHALTALADHSRRCVFPIGHLLNHWPEELEGATRWTDYLVIPVWEDLQGAEHRPVIFCHAFFAADSLAESELLQSFVLPMGAAIAGHFYESLRREEEEGRKLNQLMALIAHTANNLMLSADIPTLIRRLTRADSSLAFDFIDPIADIDRNSLLEHFGVLKSFDPRMRTLLAMGEMAARRSGELPEKLQYGRDLTNPAPYPLDACLRDARKMLEDTRAVSPRLVRPFLISDAEIDTFSRIALPRGYLSDVLITAWIYEVFFNAAKHGTRDDAGIVKIQVSAHCLSDGSVTLEFRNRCSAEARLEQRGKIKVAAGKEHGFLTFSAALLKYFGEGVAISSSDRQEGSYRYYETLITLGPIVSIVQSTPVKRVATLRPIVTSYTAKENL